MLHRGIVSSKSLLDLNLDLDMELAAYSGPQYGDAFARGKPRLPGINDMKPPKGTAPGFVRTASTVDLSPVFPFKGPGARVKKLTRFEAEVAAPRLSTSPTHSLPGLYAPWSKNSLLYRQKNGLLKHSSSLDSFDALLNAPARLLRSNRSSRESSRSSRDQPLLLIDEQAAASIYPRAPPKRTPMLDPLRRTPSRGTTPSNRLPPLSSAPAGPAPRTTMRQPSFEPLPSGQQQLQQGGAADADEKRAATLLQSSMRGKARRAEHLKHKQERDKAAVKLQAARRGHVSRRDLKEAEAEKNKAASKVQKLYRGGHARAAAAAEKEEAEILAKLNSGESQTTGPESFKKKKKRTRSGSLPFMDRIELEGEEGEGEAE